MLFNTLEFWLFFAGVAGLGFALPSRAKAPWLLFASVAFYMRWNAAYIVLVGLSGTVDYVAGRLLGAGLGPSQRRAVMWTSVSVNLGVLFSFKYWTFAHQTVGWLLGMVGVRYAVADASWILPVGISFYTFQTMSYTLDLYRGTLREPERNPVTFGLYVLFFPQLVAGPIERAGHLLGQLRAPLRFDAERVSSGLQLAAWGLFKKVVIADRLAVLVDSVFAHPSSHNSVTFAVVAVLFTLQIYCDFSGYSSIAVGTARVLGIDLMRNFERPFFATDIADFWHRWHISLSTWLRDYVYIPLGGNRNGRTASNLLITMLVGGIWHGAGWNFVVWGAAHGLWLAAHRGTQSIRDRVWGALGPVARVRSAVGWAVTLTGVCGLFLVFRASGTGTFGAVLAKVASPSIGLPFVHPATLAYASIGLAVLVLFEVCEEFWRRPLDVVADLPLPIRWAFWYGGLALIVLFGVQSGSQFIYFQF